MGTLVVWTMLDYMRLGKPTAVGAATGIVVGLVAITPAAGFIGPMSAIALGAIAAVPSYFGLIFRAKTQLDDSLDVVAAHGVGGTVGALLTGVFAQKALNSAGNDGLLFGNPGQLGVQAMAVVAAMVYSGVVSFILLKIIGAVVPLRATAADEGVGLDLSVHGEEAYVAAPGFGGGVPAHARSHAAAPARSVRGSLARSLATQPILERFSAIDRDSAAAVRQSMHPSMARLLHTEGMDRVNGLHHITAIAGPPQENLDFYAGVLGMRLVKRSVNQDDPGTYHLFYADAEGHPGTDLTFFPWTHLAPPRIGHGLAVEVGLEVPAGSLDYLGGAAGKIWHEFQDQETRFGDSVLPATDPHGPEDRAGRKRTNDAAAVHAMGRQSRCRASARYEGYTARGSGSGTRHRAPTSSHRSWGSSGSARSADGRATVLPMSLASSTCRKRREARRGAWGVGSVHHLAWSVRRRSASARRARAGRSRGGHATEVIDRFWFKSVVLQGTGRCPVRDRDGRSWVRGRRGPGSTWASRSCCRRGWSRTGRPSNVPCRL